MYLLDSNDTPFQVYGKIDILEEGCVIYDNTKELSKDNAYAKQICINAFNCLFKREIENNKELLLELENYIFDFILNNTFLLPKDILDRMSEHINIAPMPKTAINRKANVNLEYYPESAFVKF
jgi:hypothetical protein